MEFPLVLYEQEVEVETVCVNMGKAEGNKLWLDQFLMSNNRQIDIHVVHFCKKN